jgi:hypothetical protein
MIAAEKIRAICQQMPEYFARGHRTPRPRDFYDIHAITTAAGVRVRDDPELSRHMFDAKAVPYDLIGLMGRPSEREFHRQGWDSVVHAVRGEVRDFNFYFDFVVSEARELQALWVVDPPLAGE